MTIRLFWGYHNAPIAKNTFTYQCKKNDVTVEDSSKICSDFSRNESTAKDISTKLELDIIKTAGCGNGDATATVRVRSSTGVTLVIKTLLIPDALTGTFHLEVFYDRRSIPTTEPTYLEELHKLDRTSQSQYIPNIL